MKTLVLGLGNPVLRDDAVGLRVAQVLRRRLAGHPGVEVDEECRGGLRLMERLVGYDRAIVIDATLTGLPPGTVRRLPVDAVPAQHTASAHDVNVSTALAVGRRAGLPLPSREKILLVGVEAADVRTFSETCSPPVEAAIPRAVDEVLAALAA
jgi:hydrogenase maturation protease